MWHYIFHNTYITTYNSKSIINRYLKQNSSLDTLSQPTPPNNWDASLYLTLLNTVWLNNATLVRQNCTSWSKCWYSIWYRTTDCSIVHNHLPHGFYKPISKRVVTMETMKKGVKVGTVIHMPWRNCMWGFWWCHNTDILINLICGEK